MTDESAVLTLGAHRSAELVTKEMAGSTRPSKSAAGVHYPDASTLQELLTFPLKGKR